MQDSEKIMSSEHPTIAMSDMIRERGLMVIDNITSTPVYNEQFRSPMFQIIICHQGYVKTYYDMKYDEFTEHDISILYPNHIILTEESSPDYNATIITASPEFAEEAGLLAPFKNSIQFQLNPSFKLKPEQYEGVMSVVDALRHLSRIEGPERPTLLRNQLHILAHLIDIYRDEDEKNRSHKYTRSQDVAIRFMNDVIKHYPESREVSFYADRLHLSPKHFGAIIRESTGTTPGEWISRYVTTAAKTLLTTRKDLTIQQVCDQLGFKEQTAFSRYFKRETGYTPKDFRKLHK